MLFIINKVDLDENKILNSVIENEQHFIVDLECPSYAKFKLNHTEQIHYTDVETKHYCTLVITRIK